MNCSNSKILIKNMLGMLLFTLLCVLSLSFLHLSNPGAVKAFLTQGVFFKAVITFAVIFLSYSTLYGFISSLPAVNTVLTVFFVFFGFAVNTVFKVTGTPMIPSDLLLAESLGNITSFVDLEFSRWDLFSALTAISSIALGFLFFRKKRQTRAIKKGILSLVLFLVLFYLLGFNSTVIDKVLSNLGCGLKEADAASDYRQNGMLLSFIPKMRDLLPPEIEGYTARYIYDIKKETQKSGSEFKKQKIKPNIIVIQNEAWWDPTKLENVYFSSDPMEFYRSRGENLITGELVTPVYGGGTCMPEFEFLTGFSTRFLPEGSYPYIQAVDKNTPSLPKILRDKGYETSAIHPFDGDFYNRDKAFEYLGFDSFIDIDKMQDPETRGIYVSDDRVADYIIGKFNRKKSDRIFIFGITMQNHGDYTSKRYASYDVLVRSASLSEADRMGLEEFTQGVFDADKSFEKLTEYFKSVDEPTVIIMYGDHLPLLGDNGSTYFDGGLIENPGWFDFRQHEEMQKTPYAIWSNYDAEIEVPKLMSPGALSCQVLKISGVGDVPVYYDAINNFYKKYPVCSSSMTKNKNLENVQSADKKSLSTYELLQYDLLYGNRYALK